MSDTPISPPSGSVAAAGVALAMALSLTFVPAVGSVSLSGAAPGVVQQTSTAVTPTVGAATLAGVASTLTARTIVSITPTVGAVALAGVTSSVSQANQTLTGPGISYLLTNASQTGTRFQWAGGQGLFAAAGIFGGATVSLQFLGPDGQTLITAGTNTTLTSSGGGIFYLPPCQIQATVTGGTPSGLYATAARIPA